MSNLEAELLLQIQAAGLPTPVREYRFCPYRKWRFDFAYPDSARRLAIECEGGIFVAGRHIRPVGFTLDCEKYNYAATDGWRVLRFTASMVRDGTALNTICKALGVGM